MVGSGASDRSKEAVGMMALHEALRTVCLNSDWTYSVFWTIRPRPYVPFLFSIFPLFHFVFEPFFCNGFLPFSSDESGEAMVVKLEMTMAACKY